MIEEVFKEKLRSAMIKQYKDRFEIDKPEYTEGKVRMMEDPNCNVIWKLQFIDREGRNMVYETLGILPEEGEAIIEIINKI